MANWIVSAPGLALASRIACRSEPVPLSAVFVTVKVEGMQRSSRHASLGRKASGQDGLPRRPVGLREEWRDALLVQKGNRMTGISAREAVCGTMRSRWPGRADRAPGAVGGRRVSPLRKTRSAGWVLDDES